MIAKKIKANREGTVGIMKLPSTKKFNSISGYFNKKYLKKALKYLDTFEDRGIKISFKTDKKTSTALLLFWPDPEKRIVVGCAEKSRKED